MSGYLNNFVGYVLNLFKKENRENHRDTTIYGTPPRRCNSVIENTRAKENFLKHTQRPRSVWTSTSVKTNQQTPCPIPEGRYPSKILPSPISILKSHSLNDPEIKRIYESCEKKWSDSKNLGPQYFPYNGGLPKDYSPYLSPSPRLRDFRERCSGLRRSSSMDFLSSSEDRSWLHNRKKIPNHQSPALENKFHEPSRPSQPAKDSLMLEKLANSISRQHQIICETSPKTLVEDHHPKSTRIPVYRRKFTKYHSERNVSKVSVCSCQREALANPSMRNWKVEGHTIYCPKTVVAYRSHLNFRLEKLFRVISKKKYCGNIIDAASHSRWMRMAGVSEDEDAFYFKRFAKGRVVLSIGEYKQAVQSMSIENNLDYWEVVRKMVNIDVGNGGITIEGLATMHPFWHHNLELIYSRKRIFRARIFNLKSNERTFRFTNLM
ncbi:uncharacterized protein CDAR_382971 [Caerostris darwini]|uniref:Uncharacterized protein n=1 Tax=Caerostris darwini TaxID=1538125 RepID=A0AAV4SNF5_9ARAC|nr:uncharacterized protein CDAR_382971 [Caerostris darwini]